LAAIELAREGIISLGNKAAGRVYFVAMMFYAVCDERLFLQDSRLKECPFLRGSGEKPKKGTVPYHQISGGDTGPAQKDVRERC
jgi:hypothetical protein